MITSRADPVPVPKRMRTMLSRRGGSRTGRQRRDTVNGAFRGNDIVNEIDRVCTRRSIDVPRCFHDCVCVSKQSEAVPRGGRPTEEGDCRLEEGEG